MRKYRILRFNENRRLFIFLVDIGPTGKWGYPDSNNSKNLFESYSSSIFQTIDTGLIDLALVDGRFRIACTLKIILECHNNSNLKILIHDFWNREHYHVLLEYLDTLDRIDRIGLFSIKKDVNLKLVEKDYQFYKIDPK